MRSLFCLMALLGGLVVVGAPAAQSPSVASKPSSAPEQKARARSGGQAPADRTRDEAAIRANVAAFVKAYNAKDAKALASLFAADAQIEDEEGNITEGRDAIQEVFAGWFTDNPQKRIEVTIESIRFIGRNLAVEKGTTKERAAPEETPDYDRYTVVHARRDGKWQMVLARDEEGPAPSNHERLLPLAWLVGEWVDDNGSVVVHSTCQWSEDGKFLLQEFTVKVSGKNEMRVSQRIGWDPIAKQIRSWVFDSEGGFGESLWIPLGETWVIKATGVRPDGTAASSTNSLVPAGKDAYVWRSRDRIVGDEIGEPVEIKVVRKLPVPKR